jgi:signal transduction histidine kinase
MTKKRAGRLLDRLWRLTRRYWFDVLVLIGLGFGLAAAVVDQTHKDGPQGPLWFDVLVVIGFTTPFLARRRFPMGAPITVGVIVALSTFVDNRLVQDDFVAFLSGMAVAVTFGMRPSRIQSIGGWAYLQAVSVVVSLNDPNGSIGDFTWTLVVFSIAWIIGFAIAGKFREVDLAKELAERAEAEREEQAQLAVADERARIARELHDVVGHSVSVMTVQASAVRRLLDPDQEKIHQALLVVEQTGREALAEMRRMVGVLRRPEESPALAPQPSLEHLDKLVAHAREAGLPVQLRIEGDLVPLPGGLDMTAYRFVQEGLTNAIKHARAQHAEVLVRFRDGHVELTVTDDGPGDGDGDKGGHGLVGMRERISVYGGELEAGPQVGGGFRLHARLPIA